MLANVVKGRVSASQPVQSVVVDQKVRAIIHRFRNNGLLYSPLRPHTLNVFTLIPIRGVCARLIRVSSSRGAEAYPPKERGK